MLQRSSRREPALVAYSLEGEPGEPGKPGRQGVPGKSAYEIARELGFSGGEREWIESLKATPSDPYVPEFPLSAVFDRDEYTKLTERVLISFPSRRMEIVPTRDAEGYMTGAFFSIV